MGIHGIGRGTCSQATIIPIDMGSSIGCQHVVFDGVHLNPAGAEKMADIWLKELMPILSAGGWGVR